MSSFISSFRTLAIVAALIGLIEGVCALALRPGLAERANFGELGPFEDTAIFGKLAYFADSYPDIIQVGDSAGFYGVRPELVMRHLGGLKYLNLSCCLVMGYRGYYGVADFMLRHNPSIKAVVLYVTLNDLPQEAIIGGQNQLGEHVQDSLTRPFASLAPPTLALRHRIIDQVGRLARTQVPFVYDMQQSVQRHFGWWAEHDRRLSAPKRHEYWTGVCGPTGIYVRNDDSPYYEEDTLRGRHSYMRTELQRFASLAAEHGARFVVAFHPFSCRGLEGDFLAARRGELADLLKENRNMFALPEDMLVLWPPERFVRSEHLHVGYDVENSHRLGLLLSQALGIASSGAAPATSDAPGPIAADALAEQSVAPQWQAEGATLTRDGTTGESRLVEAPGPGFHRLSATLSGLKPGATVFVSLPARPIGTRALSVELEAGEQSGAGVCNPVEGWATRERDMLDAGLDVQPDGTVRCWVAMPVQDSMVTLRLGLLNLDLVASYAGDGSSGATLGDVSLRQTHNFLRGESSPW